MTQRGLALLPMLFLLTGTGAVSAATPQIPTAPPYIALSDNLDEPNGFGFCIDTLSRGETDLMHTHTCKPKTAEGTPKNDSGHDVRFSYDKATHHIASYAFEGKCLQALIADTTVVFALLKCSDAPRQEFVYNEKDQTLRLNEDRDQCIVAGSETIKAGPWVKRALILSKCDETDEKLKQWTVVSE